MAWLGFGEEGLGVRLDQPVQRGLLRPVALAVDRGSIRRPMARTGLPTDGLHACSLDTDGVGLMKLMEQDHTLGYRLMTQLTRLVTGTLTAFASG